MSTFFSILINCIIVATSGIAFPDNPRRLYIFGKEQHALVLKQQVILLRKDSQGLAERDIQIIPVTKESSLWKTFKALPTDFTIILIGKDGGEKYRSNQLLQPSFLYGLIDAMPMRKNEIKNRPKNQ